MRANKDLITNCREIATHRWPPHEEVAVLGGIDGMRAALHRHELVNSGFRMEIPAETSQRTPIALPDDVALRAIAEGVEAETGDRFFSSLARNLALALRCGTLRGTPCESVRHGEVANTAELVRATSRLPFANRVGAQSCRGVPVFDEQGRVFGHVAISTTNRSWTGLRGLAARVRAEIVWRAPRLSEQRLPRVIAVSE